MQSQILMSQSASQSSIEALALLTEVSQMLTSFDQERVLKNVIDLVMRSFGVAQSTLLMQPEFGGNWRHFSLQPRFQTGMLRLPSSEEAAERAQRIVNEGLAKWVIQTKSGTIIPDTSADERWIGFPDMPTDSRSVLCVPFMYDDNVAGIFTLQHPQPQYFTEADLQLMMIIANQVSVAMRNAQLFTRMQAQQRQLEAVLRALPDVLMVLDENGMFLLTNEAALNLLGFELPQNIAGRTFKEFALSDSSLKLISDIVDSPLQSGQRWSFDAHSEQRKRDYVVNVSVWENVPNSKSGYVVVMRDITQMRDLNRFKDEMLQMASHDLRSPLALIVGYCSLMQLDIDPNHKVGEYLTIVQQQTERMTGLLDDLLRVEKIRTSPLELFQRSNFKDVVTKALNHMRVAADNKQQRLSANIHLDTTPPILMSAALIREAMENMLTNAVKYTPQGGKITVHAFQEGDRVKFIVEDTGIGIAAEHLPRVFDSFYRARQMGTENIEGRGLGLSLVKTVIERHHGEVWVESEVGVGSRFGLWLPVQ
jgi:PAS domain S-box-containing protein